MRSVGGRLMDAVTGARTVAVQAVVLCGGRGTRLGPLTRSTPKALCTVAGQPFLDILLGSLHASGIDRVHLCLGHLAGQIHAHLCQRSDLGQHITWTAEPHAMGTGGALRHATAALDQVFIVVMGDTYLDVRYEKVAAALPADAEALMLVTSQPSSVQPNVAVDGGRVIDYNKQEGIAGGWTDTGVAVIRRRALETLPADTASDLAELFAALVATGTLAAKCIDTPFYDIGTLSRLQRFNQFLEQRI